VKKLIMSLILGWSISSFAKSAEVDGSLNCKLTKNSQDFSIMFSLGEDYEEENTEIYSGVKMAI
jgi:hypothetical protein